MKPVLLNFVTLAWLNFAKLFKLNSEKLTWPNSKKLFTQTLQPLSVQSHDVTQHQLNGEKDSMVLISRVDRRLLSLLQARPALALLLEVGLQALHEDLAQATAEDCASFSWQSSS